MYKNLVTATIVAGSVLGLMACSQQSAPAPAVEAPPAAAAPEAAPAPAGTPATAESTPNAAQGDGNVLKKP